MRDGEKNLRAFYWHARICLAFCVLIKQWKYSINIVQSRLRLSVYDYLGMDKWYMFSCLVWPSELVWVLTHINFSKLLLFSLCVFSIRLISNTLKIPIDYYFYLHSQFFCNLRLFHWTFHYGRTVVFFPVACNSFALSINQSLK